jgi:hypothetical protein
MSKKNVSATRNPQTLIEKELATLKNLIPFEAAQNLDLCWKPDANAMVFGEIENLTIFLYDENQEEAIVTLRHEYVDFYLSTSLIRPLLAVINLFIELKTKEIYKEKERVVDSLIKFINLSQDATK